MVERIRTLLETRQLTPTQFADAIGIARPIVSHILSGRNKPSLEVVQRILAAMPDLSMPWLLNGTGPMLAAAVAPVTTVAAPAAAIQAVAPPKQAPQVPEKEPAPAPDAIPVVAEAPATPAPRSPRTAVAAPTGPISRPVNTGAKYPVPKRFTTSRPNAAPAPSAAPLVAQPQPAVETPPAPATSPTATVVPPVAVEAAPAQPAVDPTAAALIERTEKPIRRIVIFYRDGSFADYQPE
ncbi:helix-turn-helix domain-containing protein [Hymenobacter sp. BT770]|uniref:helix-turn-helix domain-containing protein n=1 Tax=Hymenobacter sp. BT770 TaxID=2886942 RepID=UPI001D114AAC|nr:helix-turn-helix domain-containing protein [Hymenobacter sp. BT770]